MVEDRLRDGRRIAKLFASEVTGDALALPGAAVVDADRDVEPTPEGALAYAVERAGERAAEVYVQPDRARLELLVGQAAGAAAAEAEGLRVRPAATRPPRTLVFVEDGAEVKRAVPALAAALDARADDEGDGGGTGAGADDAGERERERERERGRGE
jgi:hypothetical protein